MKVQNLAVVIHIHVFLSKKGIWETLARTEHPYYHLKGGEVLARESFPNQSSCRNQPLKKNTSKILPLTIAITSLQLLSFPLVKNLYMQIYIYI